MKQLAAEINEFLSKEKADLKEIAGRIVNIIVKEEEERR